MPEATYAPSKAVVHSKTWTFFEGDWHEGNVPIMGPRTHGAWLGSTVFDGGRAFEGVAPDLDLHCARINISAVNFMLAPLVPVETWIGLAREGIARFDRDAALYIRPMYWAEAGAHRRRRAVRSGNRPAGACRSTRPRCRTRKPASRPRSRPTASRPPKRRRSMPRPAAFTPTTPGP